MRFFKFLIASVLIGSPLVAVSTSVSDAGISVSEILDRAEVPYESTAVLEVSLSWPGPAGRYLFDRPPQLALERLKVAQISSTVSVTGGGPEEVTTKKVRFTLKPTSSGLGKIDPATFGYLHVSDSVSGTVSTQALTISIADPLRVAKRKAVVASSRIRLAITAAVVLFLIGGVYLFIRARNRRPRPVVKTPAELFLEELGTLRQTAGGDLKRFQTGLFKLMTVFLAGQFRIDLAGLSTQEMLDMCEHTTMTEFQRDKFAGWLWRAEREKFSPLAYAPGETIRLEAEIREFFETEMSNPR
jgi:hypothetical protein